MTVQSVWKLKDHLRSHSQVIISLCQENLFDLIILHSRNVKSVAPCAEVYLPTGANSWIIANAKLSEENSNVPIAAKPILLKDC